MRRTLLIPALLSAAVIVYACSDDPVDGSDNPVFDYGSAVSVGNGTAKSYIVSEDGIPTEIGIALSETALDDLPPGETPMDGKSYTLPLPASNTTGYQIVELNWNPAGHPPPMVYTVPHFDFHFYTIPLATRNAILPTDPQFGAKAANYPPESERPAGYNPDAVPGGATVAIPRMGVHWTNSASHEFHGSPFTATFVLGSWDGNYIFLEPMVALSYLATKPDFESAAGVPASIGSAEDRPTSYRVTWNADANEYRVSLTHLGGH